MYVTRYYYLKSTVPGQASPDSNWKCAPGITGLKAPCWGFRVAGYACYPE